MTASQNEARGSQDRLPGAQSPSRPPGRRARRAAETRIKLFHSALQLFADHGFTNVTVEDITEAADVGKGTFFNYFESKEHVLGVMAEIQLSRINEAARQAASARRSIRSVLHHMVLRLAEEPGRSPHLARAVIGSFLASEVVRNLVENEFLKGRETLAAIIREGQGRGEIDLRRNPDDMALQLQQSMMGTVLLWSLHGGPELTRWAQKTFDHFWRSVAVRG